jgi:hypothetical protein
MGIVYHRGPAVKRGNFGSVNQLQLAEAGMTVAGGATNHPALQEA